MLSLSAMHQNCQKAHLSSWLFPRLILLAAATCLPFYSSEAAVEAWVQRFNQRIDSDDQWVAIANDSAGNVIAAGYTDEGTTGRDILVIKYANSGVALWTNRYDGPQHSRDEPKALGTDTTGNVFVTGFSSRRGEFNEGVYVTLAYSSAGTPMWTNRFSGPDLYQQPTALAVADNGNVIVTGTTPGTNYVPHYQTIAYSGEGRALWTNRASISLPSGYRYNGPTVTVDSLGNVIVAGASSGNYITIAYSSSGLPLWTNSYNGPANGEDFAVAVRVADQKIIVTGSSANSSNSSDYVTIAYTIGGGALWTNRYRGMFTNSAIGVNSARGLATDGNGNIFVTGSSTGGSAGSYNDAYATVAYSSDGLPLWTNRYDGPGGSEDAATSVTANSDGVFVTGHSDGGSDGVFDYVTIRYSRLGTSVWTNVYRRSRDGFEARRDFDEKVPAIAGRFGKVFVAGSAWNAENRDGLLIAYSTDGLAAWTNRYNGQANSSDAPAALAVDDMGNVYVTGYSFDGANWDRLDVATVAYTSAGLPLWTNVYRGPANSSQTARAIATGNGRVVIAGTSSYYDTNVLGSQIYVREYVTIAYTSTGMPLWTNRYRRPASRRDEAAAVAVDATGNVFLTGFTSVSNIFFPNTGESGLTDYGTIAYSTEGRPRWTNYYNNPRGSPEIGITYSYDDANAIAVDSDGTVFVTGHSASGCITTAYANDGRPLWTNFCRVSGERLVLDKTGKVIVGGGSRSYDYGVVAYTRAGVPLWTNHYDGPVNSDDQANGLAADDRGNVYVTGWSIGNTNTYNKDYATIAYSGTGVPLWTNRYNGPADGTDVATAVVVDSSGNVIVTGYSVKNDGTRDSVTIGYSNAGVALWTNRHSGFSMFDGVIALAADRNGNVFVVGSLSSGSTTDFGTIMYAVDERPTAAISRSGSDDIISWPAVFGDFVLEESSECHGSNWQTALGLAKTNGATKSVAVSRGTGNKVFA